MVHTDSARRTAFKKAIFAICGSSASRPPKRSCLSDIGRRAANLVGRSRPWGGAHLYTLLHPEKWPGYGIHEDLFNAVMKLAGMDAMLGARAVRVYGRGVREGAVVLLKSRKCARPSCRVHFVGLGKYCSEKCRKLRSRYLRRQAAKRRRLARLQKRHKGKRPRKRTRQAR